MNTQEKTTVRAPGRNRTKSEPKQTAASVVFAAIRQDILTGALAPGVRLRIDALSAQYKATINPVREALNRLVSEGLVEIADQRGFSVAPISIDHWQDLVRTRCLVESCALTEAIGNRTESWEDEIVLSLHRLTRTQRFLSDVSKEPNPDWEVAHHRYHNALLATCNSQILLQFCEDLREQSDRYRHIAAISPDARLDYNEEHRLISEAALDGDAALATQRLTEHYRRTLAVVENYLRSER